MGDRAWEQPPDAALPRGGADPRHPAFVLALFGGAVLIVLVLLPFFLALVGLGGLSERSESEWRHESSPDGRFVVARETSHSFLDAYERLWIARAGDAEGVRWREIAPEVDGSWGIEWWSPHHLVLTDHGAFAERRHPVHDQLFEGVRIETRRAPEVRFLDSPDGRFHVVLWSVTDSRGARAGARLDSAWDNPVRCAEPLVPEGPWRVEGSWSSAHAVRVLVTRLGAGSAPPAVPSVVAGIAVEAVLDGW
jgi:hypothetical protein